MQLVDEKFLTQDELYITVSTEQTNSLHIHKSVYAHDYEQRISVGIRSTQIAIRQTLQQPMMHKLTKNCLVGKIAKML